MNLMRMKAATEPAKTTVEDSMPFSYANGDGMTSKKLDLNRIEELDVRIRESGL